MRTTLGLLLLLLAGVTSACVNQPQVPSDCDAPTAERSATLTDAGLDPRDIGVCRGQEVVLTVKIEADGVLHIHGYDAQAKEVRVGQTVTFDFPADHAGQFVIELHTQEVSSGLNMGVFTVHEH